MRQLIIKYTLLVIVTTLIARLVTTIIMFQFPMIYTQINPDGSTTTFPLGFVERALEYLMNIVIIVSMKKDLEKQNLTSVPLLIVTFFSGFVGVTFFLLISLQNKLTFKRQTP
jgi:hypothetical protein